MFLADGPPSFPAILRPTVELERGGKGGGSRYDSCRLPLRPYHRAQSFFIINNLICEKPHLRHQSCIGVEDDASD